MAALLPFDLVDPIEATIFVRQLPDPYGDDPETISYLNVLADAYDNLTNKVRIGQVTQKSYAAIYRTWDTEAPLGKRQLTYNLSELQLPPIDQKLPLSESEMLDLYFIDRQGTTPPIDKVLVDQAFDDLARQTEQIKNRVALAKAQVLTTGKFTLAGENGLFLETDYGVGSGQKPTASPLWTATTTSAPLDDEQAWILAMTQLGYRKPTDAWTTLAIATALRNNIQYKTVRYAGSASLTNVPQLTMTEVNQVRADFGLPKLHVVQHSITDYTGTDVPLVPAGKFILTAPGIGHTPWGVSGDSLALGQSGALTRKTAPGLIGGTYHSFDPVTKWTKVSGVVAPVLDDYRQLTIATVG
jgi:hypothetical protein